MQNAMDKVMLEVWSPGHEIRKAIGMVSLIVNICSCLLPLHAE